jgi:hypothetical protein
MATGNLTVAGNVTGGPDGARTFGPLTTLASAAVDQTLQQALSSGDNTITVPSTTTAVVIMGPNLVAPGNVAPNPPYNGTIKYKAVAGDSGETISNYGFQVHNWAGSTQGTPSPPASFVLNASTSTTVEIWFM